jgi:hypothetical protein
MADAPATLTRDTSLPARNWRPLRFVPLGFAAIALLLGLWTGFARLGLTLPGGVALADFHGALMIAGFLGTLISLERAVALGRWWSYLAPATSAAAAVLLIAGATSYAAFLFFLAGLLLTFNSLVVVTRQLALFTVMLAVAAACWAVGTAVWILGGPVAGVSGWWLSFLVLTVAAERLELSRLLSPPPLSQAAFVVAVLAILAGAARGELARGDEAYFMAFGLLATTAWLLGNDVARRTVRMGGQTRFSASCMLLGYFWLGAAGLLLVLAPPAAMTFSYDAAVHAIAIGFIFSMIFAHAPIVLPAVVGLRVKYSAALYAPLALLHVALLLRIGADLGEWIGWRALTGPLTALALLGYAGTLITASLRKA